MSENNKLSYCPKGERRNPRTKKCEPKKEKKSRTLRIRNPIQNIIQNPLVQEAVTFHPTEIASNPIIKSDYEQPAPIQQIDVNIKTNTQELRDILADLLGTEKGKKTSHPFNTKQQILDEIIRLRGIAPSIVPETSKPSVLEEKTDIENDSSIIYAEPEQKDEEKMDKEDNKIYPVTLIEDDIEEPNAVVTMTNDELLAMEKREGIDNNEYDFLYPTLDDPNFNIKIAKRREFNVTKYDGEIKDIKKQAQLLCNADFELMPHQLFVKNFMSFQTPYNGLLLYHSLGTGKTCSAIGVAEEMRSYMKQLGISQKIFVVASPNVQANFRMQLFDDSKLEEIHGLWNLNTCIGNSLLKEINPTHLKGLTKERVSREINSLINANYKFMGYLELANFIDKHTSVSEDTGLSKEEIKALKIKKIKRLFNHRLVIIDEVHNIRKTEDNKKKRIAELLANVAKYSDNMRLLLLSATPMYNSYQEILWLVNLLNINDKRATIESKQVFDKNGDFIEGGKELLERKLTGYVSYVRGENPYSFPFRIYPVDFSPENILKADLYPKIQMNGSTIEEPIQHVPVFVTPIGEYQKKGYQFIMNHLRASSFDYTTKTGKARLMPTFENMESFGYTLLQTPLEALNIVYPNTEFDTVLAKPFPTIMTKIIQEENESAISNIVGINGLSTIMQFKKITNPQPLYYDFDYKPEVLKQYGRIFNNKNIGKYSSKIAKICNSILTSKGIVLVYSQYIAGGSLPIALALEELGFQRYGSASHTRSLFKKPPIEPLDSLTMKPKSETVGEFKQARYVMITGDKHFSPDNAEDIKYITKEANKNGENVKVVLISKAAAEGLDFKAIRQIHILEPWYNMNRIEQIIGRGVRNLSHCKLPFEERNVEIYLHATVPMQNISSGSADNNEESIPTELPTIENEEPADLYVYRLAEKKAKQIGKITRLMKEVAIDCILNIGQINLTVDQILTRVENQNINISLSSGKTIEYKIGDKPFTEICDYMDNCSFTCKPNTEINKDDITSDTYNIDFIRMNNQAIMKRIRQLYQERNIYEKESLLKSIEILKPFPREQMFYALSQFIDNKDEYLTDKYGRRGYLVNHGDYYSFQPSELTDENASVYERSVPVEHRRKSLFLELSKEIQQVDNDTDLLETSKEKQNNSISYQGILDDIKKSMSDALNVEQTIPKGNEDWFKHVSTVIDRLQNDHMIPDNPKIPIENLTEYIIYHYLDISPLSTRMTIIKEIYKGDYIKTQDVEDIIKKYFDERVLENPQWGRAIVLADNENTDKLAVLIQSSGDWNPVTYTQNQRLTPSMIERFTVQHNKFHQLIGFMHVFRDSKEMVFKTKDVTQERNNKGAKCENSGKAEIIKLANTLLGSYRFMIENTEPIKKTGMAVIVEMLMRYFTDYKKNGQVFFFTSEQALINRIVHCKQNKDGIMTCL